MSPNRQQTRSSMPDPTDGFPALTTTSLPDAASVRIDCPAKTNMMLRVGRERTEAGNRHRLETLYCGIGVYDTVTLRPRRPGSGYTLTLEGEHLGDLAEAGRGAGPGGAKPTVDPAHAIENHAVRALLAMSDAYAIPPDIAITISKGIPVGAGLGGGSADAAGTLLGLKHMWGLAGPASILEPIASQLGADMPFCLHGGLAIGTGFGQRLRIVEESSELGNKLRAEGFLGETLVGAYRTQLSTAEVYGVFDRLGSDPGEVNDLQRAALQLHPRSGAAIALALSAGATHAFVSGSGPSVIACVKDGDVSAAVQEAWHRHGAVDRSIRALSPVGPVLRAAGAIANASVRQ